MFKTNEFTNYQAIKSAIGYLSCSRISRSIAKKKQVLLALLCMLVVTACSDADDIDRDSPIATITSHQFGEEITGSQNTTLAGTVSSDVSSLTVKLNDAAAVEVTPVGVDFSTDLTLAQGTNTIVIKVRDATGNSRTSSFTLHFPFLALTNDQAAAVVIGQNNVDVNQANQGNSTPEANSLNQLMGAPFKTSNGTLYLPDTGNNRILGFSSVPADNNLSASSIVGQVDFVSNTADVSPTKLNAPSGFVITDSQYFAVDTGNNRVLIWGAFPSKEDVNAIVVLGQTDFISAASGCGADTLSAPSSIRVVNDKLILSDSGNHRVLIWNTIPTVSEFESADVAPDLVIGQQNLNVCAPNDPSGTGTTAASPTASTLSGAGDIWSDGERLLVADTDNHRILIWNTFPTTDGQAADHVLGQADMNTAVPGLTQNGLSAPKSVYSNGNQVFVADSGNERVMIWDTFPAANQTNANRVIGQVDFVTKDVSQTSGTRMTGYDSLFADRDQLLIVDSNRVMVFQVPQVP